MNPWYTPRPNTDLPAKVDPHFWAAAIANRSDATLIASLTDDLLDALHARKQMQAELEQMTQDRDRLTRWQAEAVEVLKGWDQCADLVPGSFLVLGAKRSACVHAYIDHLQTWNRALQRGEVPG